jgi:1,4-alpha-glucan branching enzyme
MSQAALGYLSMVLHAHLPYVRHPEHDDPLEEDWLHEAVIECYLPLLAMMERLKRDSVPFRITLTLSPTLLAMLSDTMLMGRLEKRINSLICLAESEVQRTRFLEEEHRVAKFYLERFRVACHLFVDRYQRDLVRAFARHMQEGSLEIITCNATHGYLPLMHREESVRAQILAACQAHEQALGIAPRGIWLAECGYVPGVEKHLSDAGLKFFFVDTHGLLLAGPRPRWGAYAPVATPSGVAVFARDQDSSRQVWSAKDGYPGDPVYRDFYKDIGHDLDFDYVRPYIHSSGLRKFTGLKYHRITGQNCAKSIYDPERAAGKAREHAEHFVQSRISQCKHLAPMMQDRPPLVVAPYDAELFGHWWFEGPLFLEAVFRQIHEHGQGLQVLTAWEYLEKHPRLQVVKPAASSWGYQGWNEVWLNESNDWIYRLLHQASDKMVALAEGRKRDALSLRALKQAGRELLLAQSSDWAFIMKTGTMAEYASRRTRDHLERFHQLTDMVEQNTMDESVVSEHEQRHPIFPSIDPSIFSLLTR